MKLIILKNDRFQKVKSGKMTVWLTLNDDFAKSIKDGDLLEIINDETSEVCYVRANGYYVYSSFDELYSKVNRDELGYGKKSIDLIKKDMYLQCTPQAEKKHGVRGIKFEYLPNFKTADEMSQEEIEDYISELNKQCVKTFKQVFRNIDKGEDLIGFLTHLAKHQPTILFDNIDELNYDIFKWTLAENIVKTKTLLDVLQEKEDEVNFPVKHKYRLPDAYKD